jgi:hypothetical protein
VNHGSIIVEPVDRVDQLVVIGIRRSDPGREIFLPSQTSASHAPVQRGLFRVEASQKRQLLP